MSAANYVNEMRRLGGSQWRREDDSSAVRCLGGSAYLFLTEGRGKMWFAAALGPSQDVPAAVLLVGEERDGEQHPNFPEGCQVLGSTGHPEGTGESG